MARLREQFGGQFVGFQLDLAGNKIPALAKRKPGPGVLKLSKSRIETAARAYLDGVDLPDPKDIVLPPAISSIIGSIAHSIILATRIWHNVRPRNPRGYEQAYRHNVVTQAPNFMPNVTLDSARQILSVLLYPECAMPYTTNEPHKTARRNVYGLIAKHITAIYHQKPPFSAGPSLDHDIFPYPDPRKFAQAWEDQGVKRLSTVTDNIFADHEVNPFKVRGFNAGGVLVTASELRLQTWIEGLGPFSARVDQMLVGAQDPGPTNRPPRVITIDDWKTTQKPHEAIPLVTEACDFVIGQMVSSMDRQLPTRRVVIDVHRALEKFHGKTAVQTRYHGYGTNPPWQETTGDTEHLHVGSPTELWEKKNALIQIVRTIIHDRPDLLTLFR